MGDGRRDDEVVELLLRELVALEAIGVLLAEVLGRQLAGDEARRRQNVAEQRNVVSDT